MSEFSPVLQFQALVVQMLTNSPTTCWHPLAQNLFHEDGGSYGCYGDEKLSSRRKKLLHLIFKSQFIRLQIKIIQRHEYIQNVHKGLGILAQNYHPKPYFLTLWEHWLGLAKPKNVFRSILNP